jgi:hypothetical protein
MPKHTADENTVLLIAEIARVLDLTSVRPFDGHVVIDFTDGAKIGGRILHAHDQAEVLTFGLQVTTS